MNTITKVILTAILLATAVNSFGKHKHKRDAENISNEIWLTRASRLISIADTVYHGNNKLRIEYKDTSLAEILANKVKSGKIDAYAPTDSNFSQTISKAKFLKLFEPVIDTIEVEDVDGTMLKKVIKQEFNYRNVTDFRIMEEWHFNRKTGKTDIQIVGICPLRQVWNASHDSKIGKMAMFWLKYEDAKDEINQYELNHPHHNIGLSIWDNYFR